MEREQFIAKMRHAIWVGYQMGAGQEYNEELNDDQLESLLDGIRFQDEHPDNTPEENHDNWMKAKTEQGWVYGEVKDFEKKTHPDLVPFDKLPEVEKNKDIMDSFGHKKAVELWNEVNSRE